MSFGADEEILQDFLVEAGEILEQLSEQLVELESRPDDADLLNAIFRGFHTVKGGAGFLQLHELVECCHIAENVFDILRKGERRVDSELMDVVLEALDTVNSMFGQVRERTDVTAATPELLAALARLAEPQSADEVAAPEPEPVVESVAPVAAPAAAGDDITDDEFEQLLDSLHGSNPVSVPAAPVAAAVAAPASDEITDQEFESLLDQLHGKGKFAADVAAAPAPAPAAQSSKAAPGDEITDDEFEALLDQLHGKGSFDSAVAAPVAAAVAAKAPSAAKASDEITDHEFENLLDELHGKGKFEPQAIAAKAPAPAPAAAPAAVAKPAPAPVAKAEPAKAAAPAPAPARAPAPSGEKPVATEAETTVRVDTARLDEIMNMVGELVLVRNRLVRLGLNSGDEAMSKAVSNLDVVTADLQTAVMKTRMQPIKKVFGRFPRLVRDLARQLKKEINLELVGEET
ncbi:Hpt domain-containing protein, partial [Pseudomonas syringae]